MLSDSVSFDDCLFHLDEHIRSGEVHVDTDSLSAPLVCLEIYLSRPNVVLDTFRVAYRSLYNSCYVLDVVDPRRFGLYDFTNLLHIDTVVPVRALSSGGSIQSRVRGLRFDLRPTGWLPHAEWWAETQVSSIEERWRWRA